MTAEIEPRLAPATLKLADAPLPAQQRCVGARAEVRAARRLQQGRRSAAREKRKQDEAELALTDLDERLRPARAAAAADPRPARASRRGLEGGDRPPRIPEPEARPASHGLAQAVRGG